MADTDVELLEVGEVDGVLDGCSLVCGSLVCFLRICEFLQLCLDDAVLDLLEEQFGLCQLMTRLQQVDIAQLIPVEFLQIN